jgi:DNA-binding winged helix-turn-helix (wHTH) protein
MQVFKQFQEGCSIFDVVLELYLSLNMLPKLLIDNNITDLNLVTVTGQGFFYDTEFSANERMSEEITKKNYKFKTTETKKTNTVVAENYLLIENSEILQNEVGDFFIY